MWTYWSPQSAFNNPVRRANHAELKASTRRERSLQLVHSTTTSSFPITPWTNAFMLPERHWTATLSFLAITISAMKSSASPISPATPTSFRKMPRCRRPLHRLLRRALHGRIRGCARASRTSHCTTRPQRRMLDGRHGRDHTGRRRLGTVRSTRTHHRRGQGITPITYMNSTAAIKAFCGERGGLVCTSSNANGAFHWSFEKNEKLFFLPDQHLGRNTGLR